MPLENQPTQLIREYDIVLKHYHDEIVARLRYYDREAEDFVESGFLSLGEVANTLELWRTSSLLGSFGIGTRLSESAVFQMSFLA